VKKHTKKTKKQKKQKKTKENTLNQKHKSGPVSGGDGACTTLATTRDLLNSKNPPEDLGSTEKPPTSP
jgi:hypothetical protein